jgi:uncharacterized phage-associated protein
MSYDARAIANFLLDYADRKEVKVTLLAVMKLIYYAHGWHLMKFGSPLINQEFEAWEHGPVVRVVWESFRGGGVRPITTRARRLEVLSNRQTVVCDAIGSEVEKFLGDVFDAYGQVHALELSYMTHRRGSPWDEVWNAPSKRVQLGMRISNESIQAWFASSKQESGSLH